MRKGNRVRGRERERGREVEIDRGRQGDGGRKGDEGWVREREMEGGIEQGMVRESERGGARRWRDCEREREMDRGRKMYV